MELALELSAVLIVVLLCIWILAVEPIQRKKDFIKIFGVHPKDPKARHKALTLIHQKEYELEHIFDNVDPDDPKKADIIREYHRTENWIQYMKSVASRVDIEL
jgi:hypothetical protein